GGEGLTEEAVAQRATELVFPGVEVLPGIRIHRLVVPTVVFPVADEVALQTAAEPTAFRPGGAYSHRPVDRAVVDAAQPAILGGLRRRLADVHRQNHRHGRPDVVAGHDRSAAHARSGGVPRSGSLSAMPPYGVTSSCSRR